MKIPGIVPLLVTPILLWGGLPGGGELWPLVFVALVPVLVEVCRSDWKKALWYGLCCGIVHSVLSLYWIVTVLGKYGGLHWFFSLQGLLVLSIYMGLYFGLFCFLAGLAVRRYSPVFCLWFLPAIWVGLDWFRSEFLTGFPWMDLGYSLYDVPILIQIADLVGHNGVTFIIVFCNCLLYLLLFQTRSILQGVGLLVPALVLLGGVGVYSQNRLLEVEQITSSPQVRRMMIGVAQGNIDQSLKWSPEKQQETVNRYLELSRSLKQEDDVKLVVWPETALPFYPPSSEYMVSLGEMVDDEKLVLLTGAPWYEIIDRKERKVKFYNSALLLTSEGITGKYYKTHLVPFGEYVPLKKLLPFLAPLVEAVGDFSFGNIEQPLLFEEAKLGVLICFESVFPELSRAWVNSGANVLVNLTNDAWYGKSSAPYQSLAMAVLRSVENRRSQVRSANTGVSAFIEPSGRIALQSEIFVDWAGSHQVAILEETTFWSRHGHLFGPSCLVITIVISLISLIKRPVEP